MNNNLAQQFINKEHKSPRVYIGQKNGKNIFMSILGSVRCLVAEDKNGNAIDTIDITKNEHIPERFTPER